LRNLNFQVLGEFHVHHADGEIRIVSRKARALLAYLALQVGKPQSRFRLTSLLWEDADQELGRASLRQALTALRRSMPRKAQATLVTEGEFVLLDPECTGTDLEYFLFSVEAGTRRSLDDAVALWRGDLLEGMDVRSSRFDEWLNEQRMVLRRQMSDALRKLTRLCIAEEDEEGALIACTRLLSMEPLD